MDRAHHRSHRSSPCPGLSPRGSTLDDGDYVLGTGKDTDHRGRVAGGPHRDLPLGIYLVAGRLYAPARRVPVLALRGRDPLARAPVRRRPDQAASVPVKVRPRSALATTGRPSVWRVALEAAQDDADRASLGGRRAQTGVNAPAAITGVRAHRRLTPEVKGRAAARVILRGRSRCDCDRSARSRRSSRRLQGQRRSPTLRPRRWLPSAPERSRREMRPDRWPGPPYQTRAW
jgi:hypothetical protein